VITSNFSAAARSAPCAHYEPDDSCTGDYPKHGDNDAEDERVRVHHRICPAASLLKRPANRHGGEEPGHGDDSDDDLFRHRVCPRTSSTLRHAVRGGLGAGGGAAAL